MHSEYYQMTAETADLLNRVKASGHKIISVGTTSTRTLETIRSKMTNLLKKVVGQIYLFIRDMNLKR